MELSKDEAAVMDKLVEAHRLWCSLERQHPREMGEWVLSFHRLQDLILARPTVRSEGWEK